MIIKHQPKMCNECNLAIIIYKYHYIVLINLQN